MGLAERRASRVTRRIRLSLGTNIALLISVAVLVTAGIGALLWWVLGRPPLQGSGWTPTNSLDFAKVVLAVVGGIGAVVALVVAYRKQHLSEAAEDREDTKLFAERFTKAADQLGSDKAPVRLAGMYALEGLAEGTPQQRQTIVNVLCAYLRMPYFPPESPPAGVAGPDENERLELERQVRLAAQCILTTHVSIDNSTARAAEKFWACVDIDLSGATLIDLDLSHCHVNSARFSGARFIGDANFTKLRFDGNASFGGARFTGSVRFDEARFFGNADFTGAEFARNATFDWAGFTRSALFVGARFTGDARFTETRFGGDANFNRTRFGVRARFNNARFDGDAMFTGARFGGEASFGTAKVAKNAKFAGVQFDGDALFTKAMLCGNVHFLEAQFYANAKFAEAQFAGGANFLGIRIDGKTIFTEARVRIDVPSSVARKWPGEYVTTPSDPSEAAPLAGQEGRWGHLVLASTLKPIEEDRPKESDHSRPGTTTHRASTIRRTETP
jgi:uncharacterized protein YjbI with pentapeptide repeats